MLIESLYLHKKPPDNWQQKFDNREDKLKP